MPTESTRASIEATPESFNRTASEDPSMEPSDPGRGAADPNGGRGSEADNLASEAERAHPEQALPAVRELRSLLPKWEARAVAAARSSGWSWAAIARLLGVTRQALHARYGSRSERL